MGATLKKVIQYATYHKDDPLPPEDDVSRESMRMDLDNLSSWDRDFFKADEGTLTELIKAANYLEMEALLDVACKTGKYDQRSETGGHPKDFQHRERLHSERGGRYSEAELMGCRND